MLALNVDLVRSLLEGPVEVLSNLFWVRDRSIVRAFSLLDRIEDLGR